MVAMRNLRCGPHFLDLTRPRVMGILNLTPDSFSDGGLYTDLDAALDHARRMVSEGADIIDIGGESTRPGAEPVSEADEIARVIPVVRALATELAVPLSVDTSKPAVMRAALDAGAAMINDVTALAAPGALDTVADSDAAICLMHMQGAPRTMQQAPVYDDVVEEVYAYLSGRMQAASAMGIENDRVVLDPGFGFGKTLEHNLQLLRRLERFTSLGVPLLAGISRKSMIGALLGGRPVDGRLYGSVAAAVIAAMWGADILRVHDVAATVDALTIVSALQEPETVKE